MVSSRPNALTVPSLWNDLQDSCVLPSWKSRKCNQGPLNNAPGVGWTTSHSVPGEGLPESTSPCPTGLCGMALTTRSSQNILLLQIPQCLFNGSMAQAEHASFSHIYHHISIPVQWQLLVREMGIGGSFEAGGGVGTSLQQGIVLLRTYFGDLFWNSYFHSWTNLV